MRWLAPVVCVYGLGACTMCSSQPTAVDAGNDATQIGDGAIPDAAPLQDSSWLPPDAAGGTCKAATNWHGPPPPNWGLYTDYCGPGCGFYLPKAKNDLPAPIQWETCSDPQSELPQGLACKQVVLNWTGQPSQPRFDALRGVVEQGKALLQVGRTVGYNAYSMVAEADGPVRNAVFMANASCGASAGDLTDGNVLWKVFEYDAKSNYVGGGYFGGPIDTLTPTVHARYEDLDRVHAHYAAGKTLFLQDGLSHQLLRWTDGSLADTIPSDPQEGDFVVSGDSFFWRSGSLAYNRIKVRPGATDAGAANFLVSYGTDWTKGVCCFHADGKDMVWLYGHGRANQNVVFDTIDIMTASFTTDPQALAPRRLRSEYPGAFWVEDTIVGCGYEVHTTTLSASSATGTMSSWSLQRSRPP